jgi:hypothetical protein
MLRQEMVGLPIGYAFGADAISWRYWNTQVRLHALMLSEMECVLTEELAT